MRISDSHFSFRDKGLCGIECDFAIQVGWHLNYSEKIGQSIKSFSGNVKNSWLKKKTKNVILNLFEFLLLFSFAKLN